MTVALSKGHDVGTTGSDVCIERSPLQAKTSQLPIYLVIAPLFSTLTGGTPTRALHFIAVGGHRSIEFYVWVMSSRHEDVASWWEDHEEAPRSTEGEFERQG